MILNSIVEFMLLSPKNGAHIPIVSAFIRSDRLFSPISLVNNLFARCLCCVCGQFFIALSGQTKADHVYIHCTNAKFKLHSEVSYEFVGGLDWFRRHEKTKFMSVKKTCKNIRVAIVFRGADRHAVD